MVFAFLVLHPHKGTPICEGIILISMLPCLGYPCALRKPWRQRMGTTDPRRDRVLSLTGRQLWGSEVKVRISLNGVPHFILPLFVLEGGRVRGSRLKS